MPGKDIHQPALVVRLHCSQQDGIALIEDDAVGTGLEIDGQVPHQMVVVVRGPAEDMVGRGRHGGARESHQTRPGTRPHDRDGPNGFRDAT